MLSGAEAPAARLAAAIGPTRGRPSCVVSITSNTRQRSTNRFPATIDSGMPRRSVKQIAASGALGKTRGRLLVELCGHPQTAVDLARRVGTSSNAVRVHLDGLRTAGLVDYHVERRGVGKPTHVFALTTAAESLLSSAYAPALRAVVEAARERLNGGLNDFLREAGVALARQHSFDSAKSRGIATATSVLRELGSESSVEREGRGYVVRSACCPLGSVTRHDAAVCTLFEGMLSAATGLDVREQCERGEHPRCAFVVTQRDGRTVKRRTRST